MNNKFKLFIYALFGSLLLFSISVLFSVGPLRDFLDKISIGSQYISVPLSLVVVFFFLTLTSVIPIMVSNMDSYLLPISIGFMFSILELVFFQQFIYVPSYKDLVNWVIFYILMSLIISAPGALFVTVIRLSKIKIKIDERKSKAVLTASLLFIFSVFYVNLTYLFPYKGEIAFEETKLHIPPLNLSKNSVVDPKYKFVFGDSAWSVISSLDNYFTSKYFTETTNYADAVDWDNYFYWESPEGKKITLAYSGMPIGTAEALEIIIPLRPEDHGKQYNDDPMKIGYVKTIFESVSSIFENNGFKGDKFTELFLPFSKGNLKCGVFYPKWKPDTKTFHFGQGYNTVHIIIACSDTYKDRYSEQISIIRDLNLKDPIRIKGYSDNFAASVDGVIFYKNNKKWTKLDLYYNNGWYCEDINKYKIPATVVDRCWN